MCAQTSQDYRLLQLFQDALARMESECGCQLLSVEVSRSHAHVYFRFEGELHLLSVEKVDETKIPGGMLPGSPIKPAGTGAPPLLY